jgi:hypothetical protein
LPQTTLKVLGPATAFAFMGFALFWCIQFHFSWVLLPPFVLAALVVRIWKKKFKGVEEVSGFIVGSMVSAVFLIPTLIKFGMGESTSGVGLAVGFNFDNFKAFFIILARFLSLVSYELPRFLGPGTDYRLGTLKQMFWAAPPAILLVLVGWAQPVVLLVMGFIKDGKHKDWKAIHVVIGVTLLLVWASFWFTSKPPYAHMYYILLPLIAIYSFYIWGRLAIHKGWRIFGMVCLIASLWFETGHMLHQMKVDSLYSDREVVKRALDQKDYRILGERRQGSHN